MNGVGLVDVVARPILEMHGEADGIGIVHHRPVDHGRRPPAMSFFTVGIPVRSSRQSVSSWRRAPSLASGLAQKKTVCTNIMGSFPETFIITANVPLGNQKIEGSIPSLRFCLDRGRTKRPMV